MILVPRDVGGTVYWYAPQRPDANPTVQVLNASGGVEAAAATAATRDSVDTTISQGAVQGAEQVEVASAANLTRGDYYWLGGQNQPSEFVRVRSWIGTTVRLASPLVYDHPASSDFEGTKVSYAITSAVADKEEENWRAIFSWALS